MLSTYIFSQEEWDDTGIFTGVILQKLYTRLPVILLIRPPNGINKKKNMHIWKVNDERPTGTEYIQMYLIGALIHFPIPPPPQSLLHQFIIQVGNIKPS